ncbi:hypothetical protein AAG906_000227 [Vitis piasezkii]
MGAISQPRKPRRILSRFNGHQLLPWEILPVGPSGPSSQRIIFGGTRFIIFNVIRAHMAALHESHPLHVSSNGKLSYRGWANQPIRQPVSRSPMLPDSTSEDHQRMHPP